MNRVIILEGPDGAGKSVLAQTLVGDYGFNYRHEGLPPTNHSDALFRHYARTIWKALLGHHPVVLDRAYFGETIYGSIMRGKSLLSPMHVNLLRRLIRANDVKEVLCLPTLATVVENWKAKKTDYVDKQERLKKIYQAYAEHRDSFIVYDYENADNWADFFRPCRQLPRNVIGSPEAQLLIVGEQVNKKLTRTDWAFFSTAGSSGFLNEALAHAGIPESELAFCNAFQVNDQPRNFAEVLVKLRQFKLAIALGRKAEKLLTDLGIAHVQVPHPAYVKRFEHGNKLSKYAETFKEIWKHVHHGDGVSSAVAYAATSARRGWEHSQSKRPTD